MTPDQLLVIRAEISPECLGFAKIHDSSRYGRDLAGWDHMLVDRQEVVRVDRDNMVEDFCAEIS